MTTRLCSCCNAELFELVLNTRWVVFLCDNHLCRLYRERQGWRSRKEGDLSLREVRFPQKKALKTSNSPLRKHPSEYPGYRSYQDRQNENYREARRLGATARQAQGARTDKGFRSLVEWLGQQGKY